MTDTTEVYLYISIATIRNERGKENKKSIPVIRSGARHLLGTSCMLAHVTRVTQPPDIPTTCLNLDYIYSSAKMLLNSTS